VEALEDRTVPTSLSYSTFLNGTVYASAVDSAGNIYVTGQAVTNLPTTAGAFQTSGSGPFVAKLNPTGTAVLYATYLGTGGSVSLYPAGIGIAVDAAGDAYVIGQNTNVPTTANAIGSAGSGKDFVAELNPTGSALLYSTYLPGTANYGISQGYSGAIAVDGSGNIYVAGTARSGFPVTAGAYQTTNPGLDGIDAFFAKINPTLSGAASLLYATYLGGSSGLDQASGIALDSAGNAYITGLAGPISPRPAEPSRRATAAATPPLWRSSIPRSPEQPRWSTPPTSAAVAPTTIPPEVPLRMRKLMAGSRWTALATRT
jgi:hypothetical protein